MISPGDRVAAVLKQDERLIEVFASAAPALERLRNPAMRRTMARLLINEAMMTPAVTSAIRTVQTALISGVTPSRTWL